MIILNNNFKPIEVCYTYDGSFYGMLCSAFEAFEKKEMPIEITHKDFSMFSVRHIETDESKAERILKAIPIKISRTALEYVKLIFLANIEHKEIALIHFLIDGFKHGKKFIQTIATGFTPPQKILVEGLKNNHIARLSKGVDLLTREVCRFIQFVRFSDVNGALVSIIEPENNVLPLIAEHFVERFPNEKILIYDKTHKMGLIYMDREVRIENIEEYEMPDLSQEEKDYQKLWKLFYNTIAIKERKNDRCRMNFMPKKYWKNMTEMME